MTKKSGIMSALIFALALTATAIAQQVVDKTVATVTDGLRTELITYSDLKWQLALQPNVQISPPSSEDLNRALRLIIDQRLFALEIERPAQVVAVNQHQRRRPAHRPLGDLRDDRNGGGVLTRQATEANTRSKSRCSGTRHLGQGDATREPEQSRFSRNDAPAGFGRGK